jgi:hypothetical protein
MFGPTGEFCRIERIRRVQRRRSVASNNLDFDNARRGRCVSRSTGSSNKRNRLIEQSDGTIQRFMPLWQTTLPPPARTPALRQSVLCGESTRTRRASSTLRTGGRSDGHVGNGCEDRELRCSSKPCRRLPATADRRAIIQISSISLGTPSATRRRGRQCRSLLHSPRWQCLVSVEDEGTWHLTGR